MKCFPSHREQGNYSATTVECWEMPSTRKTTLLSLLMGRLWSTPSRLECSSTSWTSPSPVKLSYAAGKIYPWKHLNKTQTIIIITRKRTKTLLLLLPESFCGFENSTLHVFTRKLIMFLNTWTMKAVETDAQIQQQLEGKSEQARPWSRDAANDQYIKWVVFKMSVNRNRLSITQPQRLMSSPETRGC